MDESNVLKELQEMNKSITEIREMCKALTDAIISGKKYDIKSAEIAPKTTHMRNGKEIEVPKSFINNAKGFKFKEQIGTEHFYVNSMDCLDINTRLYMQSNFNFIGRDVNSVQLLVTVDSSQFINIERMEVIDRVQSVLVKLMPYYLGNIYSIKIVPVVTDDYEYFQVTYTVNDKVIPLSNFDMNKVLHYLHNNECGVKTIRGLEDINMIFYNDWMGVL